MFRDIAVLIAEDDPAQRAIVERVCEGLGFQTDTISETRRGVGRMADFDILLADCVLLNGRADILLEQWVGAGRGPVCIMADRSKCPNPEIPDCQHMLVAGAWNILMKPVRQEVIGALLHHYGRAVLSERRRAILERDVQHLKRIVFILFLTVAALLGERFLPILLGFLH